MKNYILSCNCFCTFYVSLYCSYRKKICPGKSWWIRNKFLKIQCIFLRVALGSKLVRPRNLVGWYGHGEIFKKKSWKFKKPGNSFKYYLLKLKHLQLRKLLLRKYKSHIIVIIVSFYKTKMFYYLWSKNVWSVLNFKAD